MRAYFLLLLFVLGMLSISPVSAEQEIVVYLEAERTNDGWRFTPDKLLMVADHPVKIVYNNTDTIPHDFNVDFEGGHIHFAVFANTTADVENSYDISPGIYEVSCSIGNHKEAGMVATLYVVEDLAAYTTASQQLENGATPTISNQTPVNLPIFSSVLLLGVFLRRNNISSRR